MQTIIFANALHLLHPALEQLTHVQMVLATADQILLVLEQLTHVQMVSASADQIRLVLEQVTHVQMVSASADQIRLVLQQQYAPVVIAIVSFSQNYSNYKY